MTQTAAGTRPAGNGDTYEQLIAARQELQAASEAPANDQVAWGECVEMAVRRLSSAFSAHRDASEAPGGVLERTVQMKPGLAPRANRQRDDHAEVLAKLTRL